MRDCFLFLVALLTLTVSSSQEIELPEDVLKDFIFIQDLNGKPALVTQKAIYRLENKWIKTSFKNILTKKDSTAIYSSYGFNNKTYTPITFNNQIHLILNGGGYVLSLSNNELKRKFKIRSFPTLVFVNHKGKMIGYKKGLILTDYYYPFIQSVIENY